MATLTAERKEEIAHDLRVAATWVQGPRRVKLLELAEEVLGTEPTEVSAAVEERVHRLGRETEPSKPAGFFGTTASAPNLVEGIKDPNAGDPEVSDPQDGSGK